ncbi:MAG: DUF4262 domain-containing protein [Shewanella sp.]
MDIRKEVNMVLGYGMRMSRSGIKGVEIWHTVGACLDNLPDMIVTDCVELKARHLIYTLYERWMERGYSAGIMELGETLNGTPIRVNVVEVSAGEAKMICKWTETIYCFGDFYRDGQPCDYVQLLWSDSHGRLPNESGYSIVNNPQIIIERAD